MVFSQLQLSLLVTSSFRYASAYWPELEKGHPGFLGATSRCGLINSIDKAGLTDLNRENGHRYGYHFGDQDFQTFVDTSLLDNAEINLDYCIFRHQDITLQINTLCDGDWNCICRAYYNDARCQSCSFCAPEEGESLKFPYPLTHVMADCSGMSSNYPDCAVSCERDLFDASSCGLQPQLVPTSAPIESSSGDSFGLTQDAVLAVILAWMVSLNPFLG